MRRETAGVTESLLQAAKEEFLTYGFMMPACGGYRRHAESVPIPYILGLATRADFSPLSYRKRQMV